MHIHSPITHENVFVRTMMFILSPIKVFRYCTDGADVCNECYIPIAIPWTYFSAANLVAYFLAGCVIGVVMPYIPYLRIPIVLLLFGIFHHIYSSIIFAVFPWENYDPTTRSAKAWEEDAKKELTRKLESITIGLLMGVFLYCLVL